MKNVAFFSLTILSLILTSCAQFSAKTSREVASLQTPANLEGIWFLQGTNSQRGPYNGEIELRRTADGTYDVVRAVTYINYYYEGFKVQEIWTGKAVADSSSLTVSYTLKQADYITRLGNLRRDPKDFKSGLNILEHFTDSSKGLAAQFGVRDISTYSEWITTRRNLESEPLWVDQRVKLDAKGDDVPLAVRAVIKAFKLRIGFEKDPLVKSYSQRKEYKDENPYVIFDPTDYEFYQKTKDTLRVTNKVTDNISLTEVLVKRNAYAPTYEEKAAGFEKNATSHFNAAGMLVARKIDIATQQPTDEQYDGDSTLWTGMYVASQAMRYMITQDKEALENVRKSLKAMFILLDITGDRKEFARTLQAYDPNTKLSEKWHRGTGPYDKWMWLEGGNNDMIKGVAHSFLWASLVIPKTETDIWDQLKEKSRRLGELSVMEEKPQNKPTALGLAALINDDKDLRQKYIDAYKSLRVKVSGYSFTTDFYWHGSADWSGINLGMVGNITNIMLADKLGATEIRDQLRERMMDEWLVYRPTRRHLHTLATYAFAYSHGTRGDKFRKKSSDAEFKAALEHSFWGLREIPYPRPTFLDVEVDHSLNPEWCLSPIPRLFWKAAKTPPPPVDYFYQGLYNYPIFEQEAFDSNFVWKSGAFAYQTSHPAGLEYSGVDYLYAYWVARYAGLLKN
ncbi:MAG: hypothetical protein JSU04_14925 [Bdellovibrionales bacterium]|nr:hypothetical protein [Bdellovibrionales bacterium]